MSFARDVIGKNIKYHMKLNNMTIKELAEKSRFTLNDLNRVVEGDLLINPKELQEIASVLCTTKHDLLKENLK